jgi:signal peptidase I
MRMRTGFGRTLQVNIATVLLGLAMVHGVVAHGLFWTRFVPSGSMKPTLYDGDHVLGFPSAKAKPPARGDVVVFRLTSDPAMEYVKRVVGLPGERVQMVNGVLHLDGRPVPRERLGRFAEAGAGAQTFVRWRETLPNGVSYETINLAAPGFLANTEVFTLPAGQYFVLGDNRDNSADSRLTKVGFVPAGNVIGRAALVYFSVDHEATSVFRVVRWSRLFTIVH